MHKSTEALVTRLQEAVSDLSEWPIPEQDSVDTVGLLRAAEVKLAELRRRLVAEMDGTETGEMYRAVETRSAKRSYNTNGLLHAIAGKLGVSTYEALGLMAQVTHPPFELKWRWTDLQTFAERYDVTVAVAKHEIEDGDPDALVGEVWSCLLYTSPSPRDRS